jgi:hypothetical protein
MMGSLAAMVLAGVVILGGWFASSKISEVFVQYKEWFDAQVGSEGDDCS